MPLRSAACLALLIVLGAIKLACYHHAVAGDVLAGGTACGAAGIALLWLALLPLRSRWWALAWVLQTIWLAVNWGYANYFAAPLWLGTILDAGPAGMLAVRHGVLPLTWAMCWLALDLPALLAFLAWRRGESPPRVGIAAAAALAALIAGLSAWGWWRLPWHERDELRIHPVSELVASIGPLPVQLGDAVRGRRPDPEAGPPVAIRPTLPGTERRSVLLIQVESLDAGAVEWILADGRPAMPHLAARAAGGTYWPLALAYHGPGGSSDGEFAVVDACEPGWSAPVINRRGYGFPHALPKRMHEQGWDCTMMLGLYGSFFDYARIQPRVGYRWCGLEELGLQQHPEEFGARDGEFVDAVLARLPTLPEPFLLHCTTMSGHIPWQQWHHLPECAGPSLSVPGTADNYVRLLRYTDAALDRLIAGFLARCPAGVVCVFGDHSSRIEADGYVSACGKRDGVPWEFVPVVLLGRDVPVRRGAVAACQLDVQRTLLAAAGWTGRVPSWGMDLIDPPAAPPPLRFHGRMYDRAEIGAWAAGLGRRLAGAAAP